MMSFWWIAIRNLKRNLRRNFATGSAIAFGFAGILMLNGYSNRVTNFLRVYTVYVLHVGHIEVFAKDGFQKFPYQPKKYSITPENQAIIERAIQEESQVDFYEQQLRGSGLIGNGCVSLPFFAQAIDPVVDQKIRTHPDVKQWMWMIEFFLKGRGLWNYSEEMGPIGVSRDLARALGKSNVHDDVASAGVTIVNCDDPDAKSKFSLDANVQLLAGTWSGPLGAVDGEVTSLFTTGFQETDMSSILLSVKHLQKLYDTPNVSQYAIWLKDPNRLEEVAARLEKNLNARGGSFEVLKWDEERLSPYYVGTTQFIHSMMGFISSVLVLVVILSVLNSVTMTVLERSQEIGMYRSVGYRKSQVNSLYMRESLILSILSLIAGGILGTGIIAAINHAKIIYHPPGLVQGLQLMLILDPAYGFVAAVLILVLTLVVTHLAVYGRLRVQVSELLGGVLR